MPDQQMSRVRQLDPGSYLVFQGSTTLIGRVFAEGTAGSMVVEHWVLFDGFVSPTGTLPMEVKQAVSSGDTYSSLTAFMAAMQTHVDSTNKAASYVKATCVYDTISPS